MMNDKTADLDLLHKIALGDKVSMKAFYERFYPGVRQFVAGRVSGEAALDIVQEVFLDVWRTAERFQNRSSVKTWIFTIARNKTIDHYRKSGREAPLDEDWDAPDTAPEPEAVMAAADDSQNVRDCINALSDAHARAVRLAFFDELNYPEIAEIEDVPVGTIKTRIHHAKKLLMRCLSGKAS